MDEALRRAGWICLIAVIAVYGTYLTLESTFHPLKKVEPPTIIRDYIRKGEHRLTGTVYVPQTCDLLEVKVETISPSVYELHFETWPDPAVKCTEEPTPRAFTTVAFAPSYGIHFIATLDEAPLQIAVYPAITQK